MQIQPVFVFDGPSLADKSAELAKRKKNRSELELRAEQLETVMKKYMDDGTMDPLLEPYMDDSFFVKKKVLSMDRISKKIASMKKAIKPIPSTAVSDLKEILSFFHIPFIQAEHESDPVLASLQVDAVATSDTDLLAYGVETIITHISINGDTEYYSRSAILEELGLSPESFLDLCLLCGTDYHPNIPGIGPKRAYQWIKTYGSLDRIERAKEFIPWRERFLVKEKRDLPEPLTSEVKTEEELIERFHLAKR